MSAEDPPSVERPMTGFDLGLDCEAMGGAVGTVRCPLLIGRDDLLELVERRLSDVLAGRGQFLLVAGQAGIGKSRFLGAIDQMAVARGAAATWGAVAPQDHDVPAASILDMARSMLRDPRFADLGRDLLRLRDDTFDAEHVQRRGLVMAMVDRILVALPGPTLLIFEDLQWADDLSLEIVGELARLSRAHPLLVCAGYRTDEAPVGTALRDWRARLLTQRIAEEVRLTNLGPGDAALVTTLILNTGLPAPREVADAVYERTDGIPLYIEELLGALDADARANGLAIREAVVPGSIEDVVLARLSHRSPEAQAVARAGAVIGRCFVPEVLAGIMDLPQEAIEGPLQELVDHFVLDPPGPRGLFDFQHQLLRDAIYRNVSVGDRRRYHARAGEFGAQLEGQSETHSSLHYERAGLRRQAFDAALAGARDAARLSAHREAFELYRRTVDNMPDDLGPGERAEILEAYSVEAEAIEENDVSEQAANDAAAAYRAAGEPARAVYATATVLSIWNRNGRPISDRVELIDGLRAMLDGLPPGHDVDFARAYLAAYAAIAYTDRHDLQAARTELATVGRLAAGLGDPELGMIGAWKSGVVDFVAGDIAGGLARVGHTATEAERAGYQSIGVSAFRDASTLAVKAMDYAAATRWINAGLRYADSIQQSHCAHVISATSAILAWADARWDDSMAQARQAVADRGCRRAAHMARWALGFIALGRGDTKLASDELGEALTFGEASEALDLILPPLWGLAETAVLAGRPDTAFDRCRDALSRCEATGERALLAPFIVTGVRALQAVGKPSEATAWIDACECQMGPLGEIATTALAHARGLVALSDGATGVARTALEGAVRGWDATGRIWEASWARLDLAACHLRSARFGDAVPLAVEVRTTASRLDSRPLADRAEALLRQARGRVSVDEPWRPLTAREFAVARLVAEGHTNAEIAGSLGIAPKTASSHVEHILAKLGASRRAEIATWASNVDRGALPH
jgi:DNA-binding CsgD family transcriptional regulator